MDRHDLMFKVSQIQLDLLNVVTKLGNIERELQREEDEIVKLTDTQIEHMKDGFTVTTICNDKAYKIQLVDNSKN